MLPLIGMAIFGLGFLGCVAWYFWPHSKAEILPKPFDAQLEELYVKEFADLGSYEKRLTLTVQNASIGLDLTVPIRFRVYPDFRSNSDFVSIYVPVFSDARLGMHPDAFFENLKKEIKPTRETMKQELGIGMKNPGGPVKNWSDLAFSGQVYVYTLNGLDSFQMANLILSYRKDGMFLEVRGLDYLRSQQKH